MSSAKKILAAGASIFFMAITFSAVVVFVPAWENTG